MCFNSFKDSVLKIVEYWYLCYVAVEDKSMRETALDNRELSDVMEQTHYKGAVYLSWSCEKA